MRTTARSTTNRLVSNANVPLRLKHNDGARHLEIQAFSTSVADKQDLDLALVVLSDRLATVFHRKRARNLQEWNLQLQKLGLQHLQPISNEGRVDEHALLSHMTLHNVLRSPFDLAIGRQSVASRSHIRVKHWRVGNVPKLGRLRKLDLVVGLVVRRVHLDRNFVLGDAWKRRVVRANVCEYKHTLEKLVKTLLVAIQALFQHTKEALRHHHPPRRHTGQVHNVLRHIVTGRRSQQNDLVGELCRFDEAQARRRQERQVNPVLVLNLSDGVDKHVALLNVRQVAQNSLFACSELLQHLFGSLGRLLVHLLPTETLHRRAQRLPDRRTQMMRFIADEHGV